MNLDDTDNVRKFINNARSAQAQNPIFLGGPRGLTLANRAAIRNTADAASEITRPIHIDQTTKIGLLERFEEMCRRQKLILSNEQRVPILNSLIAEILTNHHALEMPIAALVPVTAYSGAIGPDLATQFEGFAPLSVLQHAVTHYPSDPAGFLGALRHTVDEMAHEEEFAEFRASSGIFSRAAVLHPSNPRGFLRKAKETIAAIAQETEFAQFAKTPGVLRHAAIHNPSDTRGFLRKARENIVAIAREAEFVEFARTPSLIQHVAVHRPSDPRGFLRKAKADVVAMTNEAEFTDFARTPWVLRHAAIHYPSDPRGFLRKARENIAAMAQEPEFAEFLKTPGLLQHAAIHGSSDPQAYLRKEKSRRSHVESLDQTQFPKNSPDIRER